MANNSPFISSTQVASSTPFDETTGKGFTTPLATDVQAALEHLRDHTIFHSQTQATSAAGTLTMTSANTNLQYFTGSAAGYNVQLPNATTLTVGAYYQLINLSSQTMQIKDGSGANLFILGQSSIAYVYLQINGTSAGTWVYWQTSINVASGIVNYNVISSTTFTTSSATDVVITGFTITPQAGTYGVWVSTECSTTGGGVLNTITIYKGGSAVADSLRKAASPAGTHEFFMGTNSVVQVDGTQAIDVRVNTGGTLSVVQRNILLIRLGT
jgi:hypothetical protein